MIRDKRLAALGLAIFGSALVTACTSSGDQATAPSSASVASTSAIPGSPGPNLRQANEQYVEICKDYVGGTGPAVNFTVQVDVGDNGSIEETLPVVSLTNGQCRDVWVTDTPSRVIVTESVPSGSTPSYRRSSIFFGVTTVDPVVSPGSTVEGLVGEQRGVLFEFTNTVTPPPGGSRGCTPGYWKQSHHFDSWPSPYTPDTLFSAVFENAFPGKTLLQVVSTGGGQLDALGRHTVAALLNAASSGLNFGMTPTNVINTFNAVFPSSDYEGQKNIFANLNERNCPLD